MHFTSATWYLPALIGMLSFACMALTLKKITYLLPTPIVLLYLFALTCLPYLVMSVKQGHSLIIGWFPLGLLFLASIFAFIGNLGDIEALRLAPNTGYASAIKAGQILVITFAALALFPDQRLSLQGLIGVGMVFGGVLLLAMQR